MVVNEDLRATAAGFVGAAVVLGILLFVVGFDQVVGAMSQARPPLLVGVLAASLGWLLCWGLALRTVLSILGIHLTVRQSFMVFSAATFANNITPFGQAGGEPFSALLISRVSDSEYETGLAAIASVDALNFVPSIGLALLGLGYYATVFTIGDRLEVAAATLSTLIVVLSVGGYLVWRYRDAVERGAARVVTPIMSLVARIVPGRSPPDRADIERRIDGFFATIERIAGDRRRLGLALFLSALGWVGLMTCLYLSLFAVIGEPVVFAIVLLAIPMATIASITPLPGGLGALEAILIFLLGATIVSIDDSTIAAAVLIHRSATYWLPILIGGGAASALGVAARPR